MNQSERHVLNLGAGIQSTTVYLMYLRGEITPPVECAIFADTGEEPHAVYRHLYWLRRWAGHRSSSEAQDGWATTCSSGAIRQGERTLRDLLPGGRFPDVSKQQSSRMASIRGQGNRSTELRLRYALVKRGIKGWRVRPGGIPGSPDFVFGDVRLIVFTDGCFWHGCRKCGKTRLRTNAAYWLGKIELNRKRDAAVRNLRRSGWRVVRIWEHDLWPSTAPAIASIISALETAGQRCRNHP